MASKPGAPRRRMPVAPPPQAGNPSTRGHTVEGQPGSGFVRVEVELPAHLARWLAEFSEALAMTPSQLLAHILTYYYEAYRVASRRALEECRGAGEG